MVSKLWCIAALALLLASSLFAQSGNATVVGQVADPSGAVVVGVTVSIQNLDTNVVQTTKSNSEGRYSIPGLLPGKYSLSAEFEGFKKYEAKGIVLQVGDRIALDIVMQVGSTGDSVTITAEVPLLRTEDAQAGLVIDNRRILELPQYNRNPLAFAQLAPNVTGADEQAGHYGDFRINGGRTAQAEYLVDGVPVTTGYEHNVPPSVPSMESVAEFKVVSNGLNAEYGRLSGGAVMVVTKSGTNELHGSAIWNFKNNKLNANDWNSNRYGAQKGVFHDNIYGGTVGGPVWLPKIYNGKNRTFFFLSFEGDRTSTGSNAALYGVPTDLERAGDFTQSLHNGNPVMIYDWKTGRLVDGQVIRDPFPGNKIPQERWDPLAKQYLEYYPHANHSPLPGTSSSSNYLTSTTNRASNGHWTGRLDQNWNSHHMTHFTVNRFNSNYSSPRSFSQLEAASTNWIDSSTATVEHVWTINPTTVMTLRGGIIRMVNWSGSEVDPSVDTGSWAIDSYSRSLLGTTRGRTPVIYLDGDGITGIGGGSVSDTRDTTYTMSADVQKLFGKHTIKAGFDHRRYALNQYSGGNFGMAANAMVTALNPTDSNTTGHPFATFLLGNPNWGSGNQYAGPASMQTYWGSYIQDDFKVTQKLTVNAGIRWDYEPSRSERFDRQIFWDTKYKWTWAPNANWSWDQVTQAVGDPSLPQPEWLTNGFYGRAAMMGTKEYPGRTLLENHPYRFSPRLAAAYQMLPRTVLRASYGINWLTVTGNGILNYAIWNVGFGDAARLAQDGTGDGGLTYPLQFAQPFPNGVGYVRFTKNVEELNKSVMGNWWLSQSDRFSQGHEHTVQLGIQHELGSGPNSWVVELNYSGNFGRNLPFWIGLGEHILPMAYQKIGPLGTKLLENVPNPFYGQIPEGTSRGGQTVALGNVYERNPLWQQISTSGDPIGTSNYNAGYLQVEHRFGNGFSFLANYTLSKLMQDCGGVDYAFSQGFPQAGSGVGDVYGLSHQDYRHKLLFNYSLDLPFGRGRRFLGAPNEMSAKVLDMVVGGWTIAGTTLFRAGVPIDVHGTDSLWWRAGQASNGDSERPIWVNNNYDPGVSGHQALEGSANYTPYINIGSFRKAQALPNMLEIGNVGTVIPLRAPGFSQWDFSLLKSFPIYKERAKLQLRMEAMNGLNHMNAGFPGNSITDPVSFGKIRGQAGSPRLMMVAARIVF